MDSRKRKMSSSKPERNVRPKPSKPSKPFKSSKPTKYIQDEDSEDDFGYDNDLTSRRERRLKEEGMQIEEDVEKDDEEDEEEEEEEEEKDDDEEFDEEEEEEEEEPALAPPSPVADLTFGQMLKKQQKSGKDAKGKDKASKASKDKVIDEDDKFAWRDERADREGGRRPKPPARAHKHAPTEVSSRFAVKRGRDWTSGDATIAGVTVKSSEERSRDPRFFLASMATQPPSREDEMRAQRNYAFLDEYRDAEMNQMREEMKKAERLAKAERKRFNLQQKALRQSGRGTGGGGEDDPTNTAKGEEAEQQVADIKQKLMSMEARKRDREAKAKAQAVMDEHRKRERDLVKQGKNPYFLKKSEQKKRLLVNQFADMSDQQVEKVIEKRRKKAASREKKSMPTFRRGA